MLVLLVSHSAACAFKKINFFFFLPFPGNPGPAKAENALSQNHFQLHKKSEKVSHPGQAAVGSFKSTDIFDLFMVFAEGTSMQAAPLLALEFASEWVRLRGCMGLARAHCCIHVSHQLSVQV